MQKRIQKLPTAMSFQIVEKTPILSTSDLTKTNHCWNKDWRAWNRSRCLCPKPGATLLLGIFGEKKSEVCSGMYVSSQHSTKKG